MDKKKVLVVDDEKDLDEKLAWEIGADAYLTKPFEVGLLRKTIQGVEWCEPLIGPTVRCLK